MLIRRVCLEIKEELSTIGPEYICDSDDAHKFVYKTIGKKTDECFEAIFMDNDYVPIEYTIVGIGTGSKVTIDISEIFKIGLLTNAKHILVAHNHLGCSVIPSESDINTTKKIGQIGKLLNIDLIDSVIVNASD